MNEINYALFEQIDVREKRFCVYEQTKFIVIPVHIAVIVQELNDTESLPLVTRPADILNAYDMYYINNQERILNHLRGRFTDAFDVKRYRTSIEYRSGVVEFQIFQIG